MLIGCAPSAFHAGDLARAHVSFVAFPVGGKKGEKQNFVLRTVLRSLTFIDSSVREVSESVITVVVHLRLPCISMIGSRPSIIYSAHFLLGADAHSS